MAKIKKSTGKILKKPKVKIIQRLDPTRAILKGVQTNSQLVRPEEDMIEREIRKERISFLGGFDL